MQPKQARLLFTLTQPPGAPSCSWWCSNSFWHNRFDIHHDPQQILDYLIARLIARLVDIGELGVSVFACIFFGFLITAGVLRSSVSAAPLSILM